MEGRPFKQRRAQAQWSETAFASLEQCPACGGEMQPSAAPELVVLACVDCERRWRVDLGRIYEVTEIDIRTESVWDVVAHPSVVDSPPDKSPQQR